MQASAENSEPKETLLSSLYEYGSSHPDEPSTCARFIEFVRSHDDPLQRSCLPGHVTGSAFVVDPAMGRTLLVHHRKLDKWLQPGGHCEPGETAVQAAVRETLEETGVSGAPRIDGIFDIDMHPIPARGDEPAHLHYDVRYLLVAEPGSTTVSEESRAVEWVDLDEAVRRNPEPSITRMTAKARALRYRT
ncbi:MAG: NUDIX hydrolase [Spirochaetae bacterium HGW-Spirochaetae-3]|jgi:8-oxo-dGTP pyrophosphatase MutT (NUDIX family)|nr:MAG: NUDIX hydrolase [Spirochaetae bacterium HGW-Spirochaetae-3]